MKILPQSYITCDIDSTVYSRDTNNNGSRKTEIQPDSLVHICNPSIWEAEAEELRTRGQPRLLSEFTASLGYKTKLSPRNGEQKFHSYVKVWA